MEQNNISLYKIREQREKAKLTQEQLSALSGVSRSLINQLETGKISSTTTDTLKKLASALNCEVGDLV